VALGASEHFALPRTFPQLREVNAYLGWFGRLSPRVARPLHALSRIGFGALAVPGVRRLLSAAGSAPLEEVHLSGVEGYSFTAAILAWAADRISATGLEGAGALGPVEAFGIEEVETGCREAGVARV
jgi:hypothetical protein